MSTRAHFTPRKLTGIILTLVAVFPAPTRGMQAVPLYDDLGDHHYAVTTDTPAAQQYFDQGLRLYYAFNHAEAVRAFIVNQANQ